MGFKIFALTYHSAYDTEKIYKMYKIRDAKLQMSQKRGRQE